jgi:hypothetical protein
MSKNLVIFFTAVLAAVFLIFLLFSKTQSVETSPLYSVEKSKISSNPEINQNMMESSSVDENKNLTSTKDSHTVRVLNRGGIASELIPENNAIKANLHPNAKTLEELINKRTIENRKNELEAVKSPFN